MAWTGFQDIRMKISGENANELPRPIKCGKSDYLMYKHSNKKKLIPQIPIGNT